MHACAFVKTRKLICLYLKISLSKKNIMSLANKKAKETKGKQKLLPKLKTILANPNKTKCPTLNEQELDDLKNKLQSAMEEGTLDPKKYATTKGIQLGLESCLRSINGEKSSCVFISLSIKPSYIVSLIARNAQVKDDTQPVYAQPRLEELLEQIFGIRALCMVFPKNLPDISEDIFKWVEQRKKPKKVTKVEIKLKTPLKKKTIKKTEKIADVMETDEKIKDKLSSNSQTKSLLGDFISFSTNDNVNTKSLQINETNALAALTEIIDKVPVKRKIVDATASKGVDYCNEVKPKMEIDSEEVLEDSDDFLGDYKSLIVHKIKGNPNKKPKKKRNKNKNKSK